MEFEQQEVMLVSKVPELGLAETVAEQPEIPVPSDGTRAVRHTA